MDETVPAVNRTGAPVRSLTACICTHNRSALLAEVLSRLEQLAVPDGLAFEVLVVDNRSTDDTREIVRRSSARKPGLVRYVYEDQPGLSHARNRGLRESQSEVIAYLDDDAVPRAGWLAGLLAGYAGGDDVAVVGGQILLAFRAANLPRWFTRPMHRYYSERECAGERLVGCLGLADYPYGANISFRRQLVLDLGGFNPELGRTGTKALSGEESELCERIRQAGHRILMSPGSIVDHYVQPERIRLTYLLEQAWLDGHKWFLWVERGAAPLGTGRLAATMLRQATSAAVGLLRAGDLSARIRICYTLVAETSRLLQRWKFEHGKSAGR